MEKKINPQIVNVFIGSRNLRKIKIYPLSMGDQIKVTDLVESVLSQIGSDDEEIQSIAFIVEFIKNNIGEVIQYVVDEKAEELLKEVTNMQIVEIANIIWKINYEEVLKNAVSLFNEAQNPFLSKRPSQQSVNDMDIDLKTSTEKDTKMEE